MRTGAAAQAAARICSAGGSAKGSAGAGALYISLNMRQLTFSKFLALKFTRKRESSVRTEQGI